jgi:hypothetical protein
MAIRTYDSLVSFYNAYKPFKGHVTMRDVEGLIRELSDENRVSYRKDGVVVVPLTKINDNNIPQKNYHREHYTKLSASLPTALVKEFSEACRLLGLKQGEVIVPVLLDTIRKADLARESLSRETGEKDVYAPENL